MDWKEVIRPTKGKLILPVVLCLFFLIMIIANYSSAHKAGTIVCTMMRDYTVPLVQAGKANNTAEVQRIQEAIRIYREENYVISESIAVILAAGNKFFKKINPWHVELNEACFFTEADCAYTYLKEEDFDCIVSAQREMTNLYLTEEKDYFYAPVPIQFFIVGFILLLIEGYTISCLIFLIYKQFKK